jgi:hypothetical protein
MTESSSASSQRPDGSAGNSTPVTAPAGYCTACGASFQVGQAYCGKCGNRLSAESPTGYRYEQPAGSMVSDPLPSAGVTTAPIGESFPDDEPYSSGATIGAVLLTVFMPLISLIVALMLRSQERGPRRRQQLKNWAIASGIWLCTGWLIPIIAFSAAASGMSGGSGCSGGIDQSVPPSFQSNDGVHWQATYVCMNGGTETKSVPASQVPGG